jgi:hypothetical protein
MIDVRIENENGRPTSSFDDPPSAALLIDHATAATHCLQYIDPYGDTIFNANQVSRLCEEIASVAVQVSPSERPRLERLIAFLRSALNRPHSYVRFVGD